MTSHRQPKLIAIDKQPNDDVMHLDRSGKADCLAYQTFNMGPQRQMLSFDLLRIALARIILAHLGPPGAIRGFLHDLSFPIIRVH
jgi:hypothetical protein